MTWNWIVALEVTIYIIALITLTLRILMKRRPVGVTLAWLLFIYILPLLGMFFYLLLGERYLGRIRARRAKEQYLYYSHWLNNILNTQQGLPEGNTPLRPVMELTRGSIGMPSLSGGNWSLFDRAGALFEQLITDIHSAKDTIFIEFYILEAKGLVNSVIEALEQAVERKVSVYVMLDSVGSHDFLGSKRCKRLRAAGVKTLETLHANYLRMTLRRQDLRQHRKLIAIDNSIAYTGSMNLVDPDFFKTKSGVGPWVDIMVRLEGDMAKMIQGTIIFDWEMETGTRLEQHLDSPKFTDNSRPLMQLLPTGPALDEEILLQVLLTAIHNARLKIVLTTPYFVPDEALLQALKSAGKRGLDVTVIVPRYNDSKLAQYAGRSFYDELLAAGVSIQRFTGGLLHTKTVIIDDHLVLIGSVNLDMRSIWLNFEATLVVDDYEFCAQVLRIVNGYSLRAQPVDLTAWRQRPYYKKLLENITQLASPLL